MIDTVILFFVGFLLLVKGADIFVTSAASIAKKLGVSELVIGLTLVSIGTSIPEYASAIASSLQGQSDLITGNVVGANINDIVLIVALSAFFTRIKVSQDIATRDSYIMLVTGALFYVMIQNRVISALEGIVFLLLYVGYTLFLLEAGSGKDGKYRFKEFVPYFFKFQYLVTIGNGVKKEGLRSIERIRQRRASKTELKIDYLFKEALFKDLLLLLISGFAIALGANYFVDGAVYFATYFNVPSTFIGVLLAFGTTMPELGVSIMAARKGYGDISIGNVVGSCITNILLILGTAAIISPVIISDITFNYTTPFMLLGMAISTIFIMSRTEVSRLEGAALFFLYLVYIGFLTVRSILGVA